MKNQILSLLLGIMKVYKLGIGKWIAREIHNWVVSTDTTLSFPCLLTWICLDKGAPEVPGVGKFL